MPPILMLILCVVLVAILLFIERKQNPEASLALWIPTIWMLIYGSRPLSAWFQLDIAGGSPEDGSAIDRWIVSVLIILAVSVIVRRRIQWSLILKDNFWLLFLYLFLGFTILWSDNPYVSVKRWIRLLGAIPIAMVILSENSPVEAMSSVFRRCAYVLIPFSIVLIKWYPHLGRAYSQWSGSLMWTGVTLTKNMLGQLCAISILFIIWAFFRRKRTAIHSESKLLTLADGLVFTIAVWLMAGRGQSYSATSVTTLVFATVSLILFNNMVSSSKKIAILLFSASVLIWVVLIFSESLLPEVTSVLGRDESFTGRTGIWSQAFKVAERHPYLGTGYGAYWGLEKQMTEEVVGGGNTGHNGLLDVYVETGKVGVIILVVFLISFFGRVRRQFGYSFDLGVFGMCILVILILSNYTESIFLKSSSYLWNTMIFLTVIFSVPHLYTKENGAPENKDVPQI